MTYQEPVAQAESFDFQKVMLSLQGRIRRTHFWIGFLILFAASFVAGLIPVIGTIISIALLWPSIAVYGKRLHDMGQSAWLLAIPWGVSLVGLGWFFMTAGRQMITNPQAFQNADPNTAMATLGPAMGVLGIVALINLGFLLWIGFSGSQPGPNKYGPNPKGL